MEDTNNKERINFNDLKNRFEKNNNSNKSSIEKPKLKIGGSSALAQMIFDEDKSEKQSNNNQIKMDNPKLKQVLIAAKQIDKSVEKIIQKLCLSANEHDKLLESCRRLERKTNKDFQLLLGPLSDAIVLTQNYRDDQRKSKYLNHLSLISEGVAMYGWVSTTVKPYDAINNVIDSVQFYGNRILKEYKDDSNGSHKIFVSKFLEYMKELYGNVKENYPTGLKWATIKQHNENNVVEKEGINSDKPQDAYETLTNELIISLFVDVAQEANNYVQLTKTRSEPNVDERKKLIKKYSEKLTELSNVPQTYHGSQYINHLTMVAKAAEIFHWIFQNKPKDFQVDVHECQQFYANRALRSSIFKEFIPKFQKIFKKINQYLLLNYTNGLVWMDDNNINDSSKVTAPPPPPPCLPDDILTHLEEGKEDDKQKSAMNALCSELNQGLDITKTLKKVEKKEITHKNSSVRQTAQLNKEENNIRENHSITKMEKKSNAPCIELQGKKWIVEYVENNNEVIIDVDDMRQNVYIYKCSNSFVKINGKVSNIVIDSCKKTAFCFDSVVSSVEFINCQRCKGQVLVNAPTICFDKTQDCSFYLSKSHEQTELVTSMISGITVLFPSKTDENDFVEHPIPEQFKSTISNGKMTTIPTDN
ncbi:hypothetical protein SNEBB_000282 [Seison nebaliae]|nr:hypothetical protein SNEBB_000282 [Seison nebaliae]